MKEVELKVVSTSLTDREITLEYQGKAWLSDSRLMYRENSDPFALISVDFRKSQCTIQRKFQNYHLTMNLVLDQLSECSVQSPEGVMQLNVKMKLYEMKKNQLCLEYDLYSFGQVIDQFRKVFSFREVGHESD